MADDVFNHIVAAVALKNMSVIRPRSKVCFKILVYTAYHVVLGQPKARSYFALGCLFAAHAHFVIYLLLVGNAYCMSVDGEVIKLIQHHVLSIQK